MFLFTSSQKSLCPSKCFQRLNKQVPWCVMGFFFFGLVCCWAEAWYFDRILCKWFVSLRPCKCRCPRVLFEYCYQNQVNKPVLVRISTTQMPWGVLTAHPSSSLLNWSIDPMFSWSLGHSAVCTSHLCQIHLLNCDQTFNTGSVIFGFGKISF